MNIFITANNTDCGKTYTTLKLIEEFSRQGFKVGVFKPIETGVKEYPIDGKTLLDEAKKYNPLLENLTYDDIVPVQFQLPAAPYVAGVANLEKIKEGYEKIKPLCDVLLIEGAGGVRVPIKVENGKFRVPSFEFQVPSYEFQVPSSELRVMEMWELAKIFDAKLFLVIGSKLGMINDFLLNREFLESKKIKFEWGINLFDESYFEITHPFLRQFNPLFIQKDLKEISQKLLFNN